VRDLTLGADIVDPATLGQLRAIVRELRISNTEGTSLAQVVRLARGVRAKAGITVDFQATAELGEPLVVVRVSGSGQSGGLSLQSLTAREREVAALIAEGHSNKQIAARLNIGVGTVKHYVHQILEKTGLRSRVGIAREAIGG
jgi:DNA-binding NarL/FixJ family response regulator